MEAPRPNSWNTVVAVKAQKAKQMIEEMDSRCRPMATQMATATAAAAVGQVNWYLRCEGVALRQAINGPTPVRNTSASPMGTIQVLKNGGPTLMRSPVIASDSVGNMVANMTKNIATSRIQLLIRKAASR